MGCIVIAIVWRITGANAAIWYNAIHYYANSLCNSSCLNNRRCELTPMAYSDRSFVGTGPGPEWVTKCTHFWNCNDDVARTLWCVKCSVSCRIVCTHCIFTTPIQSMGRVMFSQVFVCLQEGLPLPNASLVTWPGGSVFGGRESASGGCLLRGGSAFWRGSASSPPPPEIRSTGVDSACERAFTTMLIHQVASSVTRTY